MRSSECYRLIDVGRGNDVELMDTSYDASNTLHLGLAKPYLTTLTCCIIPIFKKVNLCAYFAKGVADNVAVWDFDEFFIPKGDNKNMLDVIDRANSNGPLDPEISNGFAELKASNSDWRGGPGWADRNAHPFCYLQMR